MAVWDLNMIGEEQTPEDARTDLNCCSSAAPHTEFPILLGTKTTIGSSLVAEDNILQIWQMSENIYADTPKRRRRRK